MLLVEVSIADAHCSRFHAKRLESNRTIEIPSPNVFRIYAKLDLKHTFLARKGLHSRKQLSRQTVSTPLRTDEHAPQNRFMPDLVEWFTPKACDANEFPIDESAEYNLCVGPLDTRFDFLGAAPGFLFIRGPYSRWGIRYRLQTNLSECSGIGCGQGANVHVLFFHFSRYSNRNIVMRVIRRSPGTWTQLMYPLCRA
jgi:hypothetical protein